MDYHRDACRVPFDSKRVDSGRTPAIVRKNQQARPASLGLGRHFFRRFLFRVILHKGARGRHAGCVACILVNRDGVKGSPRGRAHPFGRFAYGFAHDNGTFIVYLSPAGIALSRAVHTANEAFAPFARNGWRLSQRKIVWRGGSLLRGARFGA
jgi:hypothetical protein